MKKVLFGLITGTLTVAVIVAVLYLGKEPLLALVEPRLLDYAMTQIPEQQRDKMYAEAVNNVGFYWDTVPDPLVARLGKRGASLISKKAQIEINNAGMRSSTAYASKPGNVFRIVCLGDSFVFGEAGKETDRFCDQIGQYYRDNAKTVDGRRIETYALGLGSWTAIQEATYLSTRISAYDPDIILMLTVANDISDSLGVTGGGVTTSAFSPEYRHRGTGVFATSAGLPFGIRGYTALRTDYSEEGRDRWTRAWSAIKRLVELQEGRGKKILLSVLDRNADYFIEIYKDYYAKSGLQTPAMVTNFYTGPESRLPHDGHPSKAGHAVLAGHYINALDKLGWLSMPKDRLPVMAENLSLELLSTAPSADKKAKRARELKRFPLKSTLDFQHLEPGDHWGLLGGLFPEKKPTLRTSANSITWATVRSGFLLAYPDQKSRHELVLEIVVPAMAELYPFDLSVRVNNVIIHRLHLESAAASGKQVLTIPVDGPTELNPVLEIVLETDAYFSGISDHRMKSYQLLNAALH